MSVIASRIPRTVIALGVVSLLTDLSSEMIYPLLPIFLASVLGAGLSATRSRGLLHRTSCDARLHRRRGGRRGRRRASIRLRGGTGALVPPLEALDHGTPSFRSTMLARSGRDDNALCHRRSLRRFDGLSRATVASRGVV